MPEPLTLSWWRRGAHNVLIGLDQFANAIIGGDPDETISSRAGKLVYHARRLSEQIPAVKFKAPLWARFVVWLVLKVDPSHYPRTIEPDEGKNAL